MRKSNNALIRDGAEELVAGVLDDIFALLRDLGITSIKVKKSILECAQKRLDELAAEAE